MKKEKRRWVITKKLKIIFICVCSVFLFLFFSFSKTHHFYVILCHFTKYLLFYHHLLCVSISFYSEFIIFFSFISIFIISKATENRLKRVFITMTLILALFIIWKWLHGIGCYWNSKYIKALKMTETKRQCQYFLYI